MVTEFKLELEKREEVGKRAVKQIRQEGKIPGVFYSSTGKAIPFTIDRKHLHEALHAQSRVYAVQVGGKKLHAIFKEFQYHPVTDDILHVDLYGVRLKDKIRIMVPIVLEGEAEGVRKGGILTQALTEVEIRCLASEVPDDIRIDVSALEVGDSIHAEDLVSAGVEILANPDTTVVSLQAPKEEVIEEVVEEELVEEEEVEPTGEEEEEAEPAPEEGDEKEGGKKKEESPG
ncbi:MAG: 50S ribosomal protein L25 [Fidelibacterota bacterium]